MIDLIDQTCLFVIIKSWCFYIALYYARYLRYSALKNPYKSMSVSYFILILPLPKCLTSWYAFYNYLFEGLKQCNNNVINMIVLAVAVKNQSFRREREREQHIVFKLPILDLRLDNHTFEKVPLSDYYN